ncbi:ribbon-helix-helix protein, CopG family [Gordonia oryzae]|uniref:Ribbon-helix-helix protein, CopG family n=1 Tax=Gordonia oryzae TaxID=2487349 RepID=A0A3N4G6U6_9ACTN|nr:CopG family transcriptional regulator [Gordonia oryzae]RPA58502.1 ribbon-helix-helix protein, CopG family [Gordonia oryzae]
MAKTTLYLPDDLKRAIELEARRRSISEAEVVREALRAALDGQKPRPRGGLFVGDEPIAERAEELLNGFGE